MMIATVRVPDRLDDVIQCDSIGGGDTILEIFGHRGSTLAIYAQGGWLSVHLKPNPDWKPELPESALDQESLDACC